jgi:F420-0:gamma-glutamyl ligase
MLNVFPITLDIAVTENIDLTKLILRSIEKKIELTKDDVIVIPSTIVSISHNNFIKYDNEKDRYAIIEQESKRILRNKNNNLITQLNNGLICDNAGTLEISSKPNHLLLLPKDADKEAHKIRLSLQHYTDLDLGIIICTYLTRNSRIGKEAIALGLSGIEAINEQNDDFATGDALANCAHLVFDKNNQREIAIIRKNKNSFKGKSTGKDLIKNEVDQSFY